MAEYGTMRVKSGLAEMLKGGVIMDVVNAEQAKIAEASGAVAVMALERVPADIRVQGGVARMSDPEMIQGIQEAVTIPVMAKCRIGHFAEAQILEALEVDYIDESEVLTPADLEHHVDKWKFTVPFVCGATNLGEALRRIGEGAAMIRTKGEAGTGDIVNAVTHMRSVFGHIRKLTSLAEEELYAEAKKLQAPYELVRWVAENGKLPVVTFTAGGIVTPADLEHHVDKWKFTVPFVCGATNLGEALRRIGEGAAMIRTKGEAGTGDIVNAVTHMRSVFGHIRKLTSLAEEELYAEAKKLQAPYDLVRWVAENGKLPVVTFTAGGIATPADASLCMQLGADGVFVGSGIFKSGDPELRAKAIVEATTHFQDADILARVSAGLGEPMVGISTQTLDPSELLETRGW